MREQSQSVPSPSWQMQCELRQISCVSFAPGMGYCSGFPQDESLAGVERMQGETEISRDRVKMSLDLL